VHPLKRRGPAFIGAPLIAWQHLFANIDETLACRRPSKYYPSRDILQEGKYQLLYPCLIGLPCGREKPEACDRCFATLSLVRNLATFVGLESPLVTDGTTFSGSWLCERVSTSAGTATMFRYGQKPIPGPDRPHPACHGSSSTASSVSSSERVSTFFIQAPIAPLDVS
jgi:hypothetical protein